MKIIASQSPSRFLLDCETLDADGKPQAQIIDTKRGLIYPPQFIQSIIARGYWTDVEMSQAEQGRILASVRPARPARQPAPRPPSPFPVR